MGAFYGSVHVRGDDRAAVVAAVEGLARKSKSRFLVSPPLGGWVGVYPKGHGQDSGVARALAKRWPGELVFVLVHDDDIFAYDYFRDGRIVDQYNSAPDYFGDVPERERAKLRGHLERLEHLAADPAAFVALREALAGAEAVVFASELLASFAAALGIPNALTSYEYLRQGETDGVAGWDEFVHVPDLSHELAQHKRAEQALVDAKQQLAREGLLLAETGGHKGYDAPTPYICAAPDGRGFLAAWSSHAAQKEESPSLERHGPPWSAGAAATAWTVGRHVYGLELSPSGRFLAVAHAAGDWKAECWDIAESRRVCSVPQVRAVSWVGFLPDESAMLSASAHGDEGQVVIAPVDGRPPRAIPAPHARVAAVHPSGRQLALADERCRLLVIDLAEGRVARTLFLGGRQQVPEPLRALNEQARAMMSQMDIDPMERTLRQQQDAMFRQIEKKGLPPEFGSADEFRARLEQAVGEQLQSMRAQQARLATPGWAAEQVSGADKAFRLAFDPAGERLFAATMNGVRVYAWAEVVRAEESMPEPLHQVDVAGAMEPSAHGLAHRPGYVYGLAFDPDRQRLVFGGLDGRVRYLDVATGRSGVLLDPPGRPAILHLGLSRDRSALALVCHCGMMAQGKDRRGPSVQFWDYPGLCRGEENRHAEADHANP